MTEKQQKIIATTLDHLGYKGQAVVEYELLSKEEMRELNLCHRAKDKPTDVLSFGYCNLESKILDKTNYPNEYDQGADGVLLGSIVICEEVAKEQAAEYGHSIDREMNYLFLHGLLHILGFDHEIAEEKQIMRQVEEKIIEQI
ncbi:MAG: rRNA maturation RNase YbeY [Firmicutes bacterium]|nr:rRNA maturation RNase YbeY [Bacillota bacterium]